MNKVAFAGFRGGDRPVIRLATREPTRIDNKDSEPKAQVRLLRFLEENYIFSKAHIVKSTNVRMRTKRILFAKRHLQGHKVEEYKNKLEHNWRSSKQDLTISKS